MHPQVHSLFFQVGHEDTLQNKPASPINCPLKRIMFSLHFNQFITKAAKINSTSILARIVTLDGLAAHCQIILISFPTKTCNNKFSFTSNLTTGIQ